MRDLIPQSKYDRLMVDPLTVAFYEGSDYCNFGYWTPATGSQKQACEELMRRLLDLIPEKRGNILDVACGLGATTRDLLEHYDPARVVGLNLSRFQLRQARLNAPGCSFLYADAATLALRDESMDNVICVEAAFHFNTRDRFYREAFRVLKPGGRLVTTDILMIPWVSRTMPSNAVRGADELRQRLSDSGFQQVEVLDCTEDCFQGFRRNAARAAGLARRAGRLSFRQYLRAILPSLVLEYVLPLGIRTYVLTSAQKPAAA